MTDTTAALRMAMTMCLVSFTHWEVSPDDAAWLTKRLGAPQPWDAADQARVAPILLGWSQELDPTGQLTIVLRSLLDGTPTHAPGMSGLDVLKWFPGQEAREQAKELNSH